MHVEPQFWALMDDAQAIVTKAAGTIGIQAEQIDRRATTRLSVPDCATIRLDGEVEHLEQGALAAPTLTDNSQHLTRTQTELGSDAR